MRLQAPCECYKLGSASGGEELYAVPGWVWRRAYARRNSPELRVWETSRTCLAGADRAMPVCRTMRRATSRRSRGTRATSRRR